MGKSLFFFFLLVSSFLLTAQELSLQDHFNAAQEAYKKKDYENYLEHLREANEMRPNHPTIVYKLAGAWALNKRKSRAIQALNQMMSMDATVDFQSDPDFDNIRKYKGYDRLVELQLTMGSVEILSLIHI